MPRRDDGDRSPNQNRLAAALLGGGGFAFWLVVAILAAGVLRPRPAPQPTPLPPAQTQPAPQPQRAADTRPVTPPAQPVVAAPTPPARPRFASGPTAEGRALVKQLYRELEEFHATARFRVYGLSRQREWLERAEQGRSDPHFSPGEQEACGMLVIMATEYIGSGGQETKYTRWARYHVERAIAGLKQEP